MQLTRATLSPASEAEWLAMRKMDLTSTEVAALFGASPYCTEFELYHRKAGTMPADDFQENSRMTWGKRLESAIASGIAEDFGLVVRPMKEYIRIPELRMAASFDFRVIGITEGFVGNEIARDMFRQHGEGVLEIKNVDGLQFKRTWLDDGEEIEAPPHIEFQIQAQMEVADLNWGIIAPLVGGNTPKVIIRERDTELGNLIRDRVDLMWQRVKTVSPPPADFVKDADTIAHLYRDNDGSAIDLSDNVRLIQLCQEYKKAGADKKVAEDRQKAARAEILTIIQAHKSVTTTGFKISAGTNKESYRMYRREAGERISITISKVAAADIEATVPPFRNVRITEAA